MEEPAYVRRPGSPILDGMDPWTVGLVALIVVGLGVILYGALSDRAKNRRRAEEMLSPPKREIPRFSPETPAPHYLSELQARRRPAEESPADLTAGERAEIQRQLSDPDTVSVAAGYVSADFVTDRTAGWAVLDQPRVLVCGEGVQTVRELLTVLERLILSRTPVVVVAPGFAPEVRATLEVNAIQRRMGVIAVVAGTDQRDRIATATGASVMSRADLQASYVPVEQLGRCSRWVSDTRTSYLIRPGADESAPISAPEDAGTGAAE